jgi:hypothetical protein
MKNPIRLSQTRQPTYALIFYFCTGETTKLWFCAPIAAAAELSMHAAKISPHCRYYAAVSGSAENGFSRIPKKMRDN